MCKPSVVMAPLYVVSVTYPDPMELSAYTPGVRLFITTTQHRVPPLHGLHMVVYQNRPANQCQRLVDVTNVNKVEKGMYRKYPL